MSIMLFCCHPERSEGSAVEAKQLKAERPYYVYIMASRSLTLYTGITDDVCRRAPEHKAGVFEGFTRHYNIDRLVYYEVFKYVNNAIAREKQIKAWTRAKRLALIKSVNPTWQDLAEGWGETIELQIPRFARDDNKKTMDTKREGMPEFSCELAETSK